MWIEIKNISELYNRRKCEEKIICFAKFLVMTQISPFQCGTPVAIVNMI